MPSWEHGAPRSPLSFPAPGNAQVAHSNSEHRLDRRRFVANLREELIKTDSPGMVVGDSRRERLNERAACAASGDIVEKERKDGLARHLRISACRLS